MVEDPWSRVFAPDLDYSGTLLARGRPLYLKAFDTVTQNGTLANVEETKWHSPSYLLRHCKVLGYNGNMSTPKVQWLSYSPLDPRFADSIPVGANGFFESVKILSMISLGRVPCRRFTARKRTSSRN